MEYLNKIEFTGKIMEIINDYEDEEYESDFKFKIKPLKSDSGLSNGEILYNIAQSIPNDDDIKKYYINYIRNNSNKILMEIERERKEYIRRSNRNTATDYKVPPERILKELIKTPEKFLDFMDKNSENMMNDMLIDEYKDINKMYYPFLPDYSDYFGSHIYFEGLELDDGKYIMRLGS